MKVVLATSKDCDCDRESIKAAEKAIVAVAVQLQFPTCVKHVLQLWISIAVPDVC